MKPNSKRSAFVRDATRLAAEIADTKACVGTERFFFELGRAVYEKVDQEDLTNRMLRNLHYEAIRKAISHG